jgi:hypothetical protein
MAGEATAFIAIFVPKWRGPTFFCASRPHDGKSSQTEDWKGAMKSKSTAKTISLLASLLASTVLLSSCGEKVETVSAATISQLPSGKTFEIDLTRRDFLGRRTVYTFNDAETDFSRVTIRTAKGVKNFGDLLKASNTSTSRGVVLGTPDDMRDHLPTSGGGTSYDCGVVTCQCEGEADCISLVLSGKCGDDYWCSTGTDYCYCDAKL